MKITDKDSALSLSYSLIFVVTPIWKFTTQNVVDNFINII